MTQDRDCPKTLILKYGLTFKRSIEHQSIAKLHWIHLIKSLQLPVGQECIMEKLLKQLLCKAGGSGNPTCRKENTLKSLGSVSFRASMAMVESLRVVRAAIAKSALM